MVLLREAREESDAGLVAECRKGDPSAFDELVRRYKDRIYHVVYRFLGNHEDAQDVCQEVFVRAYRGIEGYRGRAKVYTWLYSIAANLARNRLRDGSRRGRNMGTSFEAIEEQAPVRQGDATTSRDYDGRVSETNENEAAALAAITPPSGKAAAFFDLDKTILAKSSSLAFAKPFYEGGLLGRSDVMRSAYAQFVYMLSGATHDQMDKMRAYMSALVSGWDVAKVKQIVADTIDSIVDPIVYEEAMELIRTHQELGRDVIVISSSGNEVVEPIGERLGVDLAIGTQVAVEDGHYTGEIIFYAYGEGKAVAMRELAEERGYDLADSYAYTDSLTDLPMLEAVGHPIATNPESELREVAEDRGWPILTFRKPVAMQTPLETPEGRRAAAAAVGGAVALGLAWYAGRRSARP